MKLFSAVLLSSVLMASTAFSATFKDAPKLKSKVLTQLRADFKPIVKDHKVMEILTASGNANSITAFSFTRKEEETNIKTIKQLHIKYFGIYADDEMGMTAEEIVSGLGKDVIDALFSQTQMDNFESEQDAVLKEAYGKLLKSLLNRTDKMKNDNLKYFTGDHSDEDGSWSVIDVLDTKTNEILSVKLGYTGT